MIRKGVCSIEELRRSSMEDILAERTRVSITLLDEVAAEDDASELAEKILLGFVDDRGTYKRTYADRFAAFDERCLEVIGGQLPADALDVHDCGVSDARTSCDFYRRLRNARPDATLSFTASDYAPHLEVIRDGEFRITLSPGGDIIELMSAPFVFNMRRPDSWLRYPINNLLRRRLARRAEALLRGGGERSTLSLFCIQARRLEQTEAGFRLERHDIREPLAAPASLDLVRAMNVLNRSYFSADEFRAILAGFARVLRPGGILITGSNEDRATEVDGGVYRLEDGCFRLLESSGAGSPVAAIIEATGQTGSRVDPVGPTDPS